MTPGASRSGSAPGFRDVVRVPGPSAWAWLTAAAVGAVGFFALLLVVLFGAPAFHPDWNIPHWYGLVWVTVFTADIVWSFWSFSRYLRKSGIEYVIGYTTLPFGSARVELRDHHGFAVIRQAGVEPLSNGVSLRLGPERARAGLEADP